MHSTAASPIDHIGGPNTENFVTLAIWDLGLSPIAAEVDIWPSAVQKWRDNGYLPESELSGRTKYAEAIDRLSRGKWQKQKLLAVTRAFWTQRGKRKQGRTS